MGRFRLSIRGLLGAVLVLALVCAGLRYASEPWALAMCSLAVAAVAIAAIRALLARGPVRTFSVAFAIVGAGYLILTIAPGPSPGLQQRLPTTRLLERLYPIIHRPRLAQVSLPRGMFDESYSAWVDAHPAAEVIRIDFNSEDDSATIVWLVPARKAFQQVGHAVFAIVLAMLAGTMCALLLRPSQPAKH